MSIDEYESLRVKSPELRLPHWRWLRKSSKHKARRITRQQLIANRAAKLFRGNVQWDREVAARFASRLRLTPS